MWLVKSWIWGIGLTSIEM
jgi:hypothetical protein